MSPEVSKFIDRIENYKIVRKYDEISEYEIIFNLYKKRISECYAFMKYLTSRKDYWALRDDYKKVEKLTRKIEKEFLQWNENHVSETN